MRRTFWLVVVIGLLCAFASPADAYARNALHASVGHPDSEQNPAFTTSQDGDLESLEHFSPSDCLTVTATSCDLLDLELTLPRPSVTKDVVLDVELRWDDRDGNQVWLSVMERRSAPDGTEYAQIDLTGDSGKSPTRVQLVDPDRSDYVIRVTNRHGVNRGYTIAARLSLEPLDLPVDHSLEPFSEPQAASPSRSQTDGSSPSGDGTGVGNPFRTGDALDVHAVPAAAGKAAPNRGVRPWQLAVVATLALAMGLGAVTRRRGWPAARRVSIGALTVRVRDARLFWKLLMPFLVIILVGGMTAAFLTTRYLTSRASTQLDQSLLQRSVSAGGYLRDNEAKLVDAQRFAANVAGLPEAVATRDSANAAAAMASALAVNQDLDLLAALDAKGVGVAEFTATNGEFVQSVGSPFSGSRSVDRVLHGGDTEAVGAPEIVLVGDRAMLTTAGAVTRGDIVGAMVAGVRLDTIVRAAAARVDGAVAIFDPSGHRVAASSARVFANRLPASVGRATTPVRQREHVNGRSQATIYTAINESGVFVGTLAVDLPTAPAYAAVSGARTQLILIVLLVMAAVIALGAVVSRSVLRRINRLVETNRALGAGNLSVRVPALGRDEVGELGAGFNVMAEQLEASYADMERRVEERTEELQRLYQDVVRGNEARSDLFAAISHEFRTPIFAILAHAELMSDPELRPKGTRWVPEFADTISESAKILLRRVNDILELAKLENTELELNILPFSLSALVDGIRPQVGALARQAGLTLTMAVPSDLPEVLGDPHRVEQILLNLLSNAIKYNRPDGTVSVTATRARSGVEIRIIDSGVGIPKKSGERIFEPFYRVPASAAVHSSSGLGLALAKRLTEAQGGTITFKSQVGVGTTFLLVLPVATS